MEAFKIIAATSRIMHLSGVNLLEIDFRLQELTRNRTASFYETAVWVGDYYARFGAFPPEWDETDYPNPPNSTGLAIGE